MGIFKRLKFIINNERFNNFVNKNWQGYCLTVISFICLRSNTEISFYLFLYTSGFIFANVFYNSKWNWLRKLTIAPLFSTAAIIVLCALFDLLHIPIGVWCIYVIWIGSFIAINIFPVKIRLEELRVFRNYRFELAIFAIFLIALSARVIPMVNETAPILHDPVAHAAWAKDIIESGRVESFYSPGLHFIIAMGSLTTNVGLARNTLMITQFFNALISAAGCIFIAEYFNRKGWALVASVFFAVGTQPAAFYTAAGKNSLIFASAFLYLTWTVFSADIKKIPKIILCNLMLLTTILSHYPAAFICFLGISVKFILSKKNKNWFYKYITVAFILGLLWGSIKLPYQIEHMRTAEITKVSSEKTSLDEIFSKKTVSTEVMMVVNSLSDNNLFTNFNYAGFLKQLSIVLLLLFGFRERKYYFIPLLLLINYITIRLGIIFRDYNPLFIVTSTQQISNFLISHFIISFPLSLLLFDIAENKNKKHHILNGVFVIFSIINGALRITKSYTEHQTQLNVVEQGDLDAFKWMSENIGKDNKFLINARANESKKVTFATDSGLWVTIYTDFETSAPFEDGFSEEVYENTMLFLQFAEDTSNCDIRDSIIKKGFTYYFQGSHSAFAPPLPVNDEDFNLVYDNGSASIYKIVPCCN